MFSDHFYWQLLDFKADTLRRKLACIYFKYLTITFTAFKFFPVHTKLSEIFSNIGIKGFHSSTGAQPDDHWIKRLSVIQWSNA